MKNMLASVLYILKRERERGGRERREREREKERERESIIKENRE